MYNSGPNSPSSPPRAPMPWWKKILVDEVYRARIRQLATELYREELRLLTLHPEAISSDQGAQRVRHPPVLLTGQSGADGADAAFGQQGEAHVRVMSQYVMVNPADVQLFSTQHPRAVRDVSALRTLRQATLGSMPPAHTHREQQHQEGVVENHFAILRRCSVEASGETKAQHGKNILSGNDEIPLQTAVTGDVLLDMQQGATEKARSTKRMLERELPQVSVRRRPQTPPWMAVRLPPGEEKVEQVQHRLRHAEAIAVSRSMAAGKLNGLVVAEEGELERVAGASINAEEEEQLRRRDAAEACVNGLENLYGLQHAWSLPLPPSGYIRVSPDPRYAMWPTTAMTGRAQGTGPLTSNAEGNQHTVSWPTAQARAAHFARLVNHRNRKVRRLREEGRLHYTYNNFSLTSLGSSDSNESVASQGDGDTMDEEGGTQDGEDLSGFTKEQQRLRRRLLAKIKKIHINSRKKAGLPTGKRKTKRKEWQQAVGAPMAEGALHINIYVPQTAEAPPAGILEFASATGKDGELLEAKKTLVPGAAAVASSPRTRPGDFIGCYRQSLFLIHYKVYCRALHNENARQQREVRLAFQVKNEKNKEKEEEVENRKCGTAKSKDFLSDAEDEEEDEYEKHLRELPDLSGAPQIPSPVLRVQTTAPPLVRSDDFASVDVRRIRRSRCWVGLYPAPSPDPTTASHKAWNTLHTAPLVRQVLQDIFDLLPHDAEGLLGKDSFVLFVLDLLSMFFPTHIPAVHLAIAQEEWVYRGTTECVSGDTFFEKFFPFPFIFNRDYEVMTEAMYLEFWTMVRIALFKEDGLAPAPVGGVPASRRPFSRKAVQGGGAAARPHRASLLVALSGFSAQEAAHLYTHSFGYDEEEYRFRQLLEKMLRTDPVVRRVPASRQYTVALARTQRLLKREALQEQRARLSEKDQPDVAELWSSVAHPKEESAEDDTFTVGGHSGQPLSRQARIAAEAQQRRLHLEEIAHAHELEAWMEASDWYQSRHRRHQADAATTQSSIECTTSSWQLHELDTFEAPPRTKDDEDELLDYLFHVPNEVFDGKVSLRERFVLHKEYRDERHGHALPWLQVDGSNLDEKEEPHASEEDDDGGEHPEGHPHRCTIRRATSRWTMKWQDNTTKATLVDRDGRAHPMKLGNFAKSKRPPAPLLQLPGQLQEGGGVETSYLAASSPSFASRRPISGGGVRPKSGEGRLLEALTDVRGNLTDLVAGSDWRRRVKRMGKNTAAFGKLLEESKCAENEQGTLSSIRSQTFFSGPRVHDGAAMSPTFAREKSANESLSRSDVVVVAQSYANGIYPLHPTLARAAPPKKTALEKLREHRLGSCSLTSLSIGSVAASARAASGGAGRSDAAPATTTATNNSNNNNSSNRRTPPHSARRRVGAQRGLLATRSWRSHLSPRSALSSAGRRREEAASPFLLDMDGVDAPQNTKSFLATTTSINSIKETNKSFYQKPSSARHFFHVPILQVLPVARPAPRGSSAARGRPLPGFHDLLDFSLTSERAFLTSPGQSAASSVHSEYLLHASGLPSMLTTPRIAAGGASAHTAAGVVWLEEPEYVDDAAVRRARGPPSPMSSGVWNKSEAGVSFITASVLPRARGTGAEVQEETANVPEAQAEAAVAKALEGRLRAQYQRRRQYEKQYVSRPVSKKK